MACCRRVRLDLLRLVLLVDPSFHAHAAETVVARNRDRESQRFEADAAVERVLVLFIPAIFDDFLMLFGMFAYLYRRLFM